jgi:hypothetical protein
MSGTTGQKHIDKNCRMCGVELLVGENFTQTNLDHCMYFCQACVPKELKNRRMYVNGKYVPKTHPLHKPGRYEGFTDAAFSSLKNYTSSKQGQVYIIRNPAFPSWCKVGMAVDAQDRLKQYQTSSPYRDYELVKAYNTENRREAEAQAHAVLEKNYERRGEWFVCDASLAVDKLDKLLEGKQLELF